MTDNRTDFRPITGPERIDMLDAIRGFALFGILLMNLEAFTGPITQAITGIDGRLEGADRWSDAFIYIFVQGKFWTLFSTLFGVGFAVMFDRLQARGGDFRSIYRRRLWSLLAFGLLHALFIWEGDILLTYALAGFVFSYFFRTPAAPKIATVVLLYMAPLLIIGLSGVFAPLSETADKDLLGQMSKEAAVISQGSYAEVLQWRLEELPGVMAFNVIFLPMVIAMFALGARLYRTGKVAPPASFTVSALRGGLLIWLAGLAVILLSVAVAPEVNPLAGGPVFAQVFVLNAIGSLLMCLGYFFSFRSLWPLPRMQRMFGKLAPLGRMALSNYLAHSLICTLVFYGYGLGYYQQLPRVWHIPFALALIALQTAYSAWWLKRFSMGPAEYVWRWLTYGKRPKFVS
ncbi:MAG TPA: DUF418 domain-containing protein [Arenimonas sp.]|nr:DUF418 domain-containing protein [Arenimonas sp.]